MDKPFKTYEELIQLLNDRGVSTNDQTKYILEREGYYAVVNGYKELFILDGDNYIDGTDFIEIYSLFVFDRHLRSILFRYITLAEATLKSLTTYEFCKHYQSQKDAYIYQTNYRQEQQYQKNISRFINELKTITGKTQNKAKYPKDYLSHYINNHDNVPLWVLMNNLSLGQAFKFYDFQQESIRYKVARRFQDLYNRTHYTTRRVTHKTIFTAYNNIKEVRNICAHDERLFCSKVGKSKTEPLSRVINDLEMVLSQEQHKSMMQSIMKELMETSSRIHTIHIDDIIHKMGYKYLSDLVPSKE